MTTNPYFNSNYFGQPEQDLTESLTVESIQMHGIDVKYIPRTLVAYDHLLGEDALSSFNDAYTIEMYIKSFDSWGGDSDFLSRFKLEIRDEVTLQVSITRFNEVITALDEDIKRPMEGDLIYFPFSKRVFEIKFVEHEEVFYQVGKLFTYEIRQKLFEYNAETFDTGDENIDRIVDLMPTTNLPLINIVGEFIPGEKITQETADDFVTAFAKVVSFDGDLLVIKETIGQFVPEADLIIKGEESDQTGVYVDQAFQNRNSNDRSQVNNEVDSRQSAIHIKQKPNKLGG